MTGILELQDISAILSTISTEVASEGIESAQVGDVGRGIVLAVEGEAESIGIEVIPVDLVKNKIKDHSSMLR